jgi:hypothetical protein
MLCPACRIVLVAIGSLVGSGAIMPNGPLAPLIVATLMIVGMALLIDAAYAYGFLFGGLVHARPILLYANGEQASSSSRSSSSNVSSSSSRGSRSAHCGHAASAQQQWELHYSQTGQ